VENVNRVIAPALLGFEVFEQKKIDDFMIKLDGTENKSNLGANAILGVSLAVARAAAVSQNISLYQYIGGDKARILPLPMMNVINGGAHGGKFKIKGKEMPVTDIQEYMIVPVGAKSFTQAMKMATETYHHLKKILSQAGYGVGVGDEGGFNPYFSGKLAKVSPNEEPILAILLAIEDAGYKPGKDIALALDVAASELEIENKPGHYEFKRDKKILNSRELVDLYLDFAKKYPIVSIEDGLAQEDWDGWRCLESNLGRKILNVGDDIYVTNVERIKKGIILNTSNAVLIKLNQIGTLTETLDAIDLAKSAKMKVVISHRSGETEDPFIADLAVGASAHFIKTGGLSRIERIAKYNQLLRIEEELGKEGRIFSIRKGGK